MDYRIREIKEIKYPVFADFLYEAIFIPEGMKKHQSLLSNSQSCKYILLILENQMIAVLSTVAFGTDTIVGIPVLLLTPNIDRKNENEMHDKEVTAMFENRGWIVIRIWECELKLKNRSALINKLSILKNREHNNQWRGLCGKKG